MSWRIELVLPVSCPTLESKPTNFVFVLADVLGLCDVGFHSGTATSTNLELTQH